MRAEGAAEIRLEARHGFQGPVEVRLNPGFEGEEAEGRTYRVEAPGELRVEALEVGPWHVRVHRRGLWSPGAALLVEEGKTARKEVLLWPTARVNGEVEVVGNVSPPSELTLGFLGPDPWGSDRRPSDGQVPCSLSPPAETDFPDGRRPFTCEPPAGTWHLRLKPKGLLPSYFWDFQLEPWGSYSLGVVPARVGSAISGFVPACRGDREDPSCRASLEVQSGLPTGSLSGRRLQALDSAEAINRHGHFVFLGVPPGEYRLTVEKEGFAPGRFFPISVHAGAESRLAQPLELSPPLTFLVRTRPADAPTGRAWQPRLLERGAGGAHEEVQAEVRAEGPGRWIYRGLAPGPYLLRLYDDSKSLWSHAEFELVENEQLVEIDLPLFRVEGVLRLGDEALAAELVFGGRHDAQRRIRTTSNDEGRFTVYLPRGGRWRLSVISREQAVHRDLGGIEVPEPDGEGLSELEVVLPDTEVSGVVVRPDGTRVPGSVVGLEFAEAGDRAGQRTDEEGRFLFRGMGYGQGAAWARARGTLESPKELIFLSEALPVVETRLVLQELEEISGVVNRAGQPVIGARVEVNALGGLASGGIAVTDAEGRFTVRLPPGTSRVKAEIYPSARLPLTFTDASVEGGSLHLEVAPLGGELNISGFPRGGLVAVETLQRERRALWVRHGFHEFDLGLLVLWGKLNGTTSGHESVLSIPRIEIGSYEFCVVQVGEAFWPDLGGGEASAPPPESCVTGEVLPDSSTSVDLSSLLEADPGD